MSSVVRFGILGTARIARTVVPRLQATQNVDVVAVASRSLQTARTFADEFGIPRAFGSYVELLECEDVDAVYVPLPPSLHCEWVVRAAIAGKHILCEKPLALNAAEVDHMIQTCRQQRVVLLDGVMWYHTRRAERLRQIVGSGSLGSLRQITSVFTFQGDHMRPENLRWSRGLGGGSLLDLGWYCVGATLWMLDALPVRVSAAATFRNDVDERMHGMMWFADDCMATFECGFTTVRRRWLEIAGTAASVVCDGFTRPWNADTPTLRLIDGDGRIQTETVCHPPQEECMAAAFVELIHQQSWDHPWLQLSRKTQRVCDLLDQSARERRTLELTNDAATDSVNRAI